MSRTSAFAARAGELARGEIDFNKFARLTMKDWERMARVLHRRWHLPPAVTEEDLQQELLYNAFKSWSRYRSDGATPHAYLIFKAHARTMNHIHAQRGAGQSGCPGSRPSRLMTPISWTVDDETGLGNPLDRSDGSKMQADRKLEAAETLGEVASVLDREEAEILGAALAHEGEIDEEDALRIRTLLQILWAA